MISDELFEELYDYDSGYEAYNSENIMNDEFTITLNDVASSCLEWAWKNRYGLTIQPFQVEVFNFEDGICEKILKEKNDMPYNVELIFEAWDFIFKNK